MATGTACEAHGLRVKTIMSLAVNTADGTSSARPMRFILPVGLQGIAVYHILTQSFSLILYDLVGDFSSH